MPSFPIQLKRNGTAAATPSSLLHGEVALNYADGKLFWKDASNVIQSFTFQAYALSSHTHAASDITSGTLDAARIANDSITYAKLQNVSATDRLLGRSSVGSGDVEEITCTSFGRALLDDTSHAAQLTTLGAAPLASPTFTGTVTVPGLTATAAILADDLSSANSVVYSFDGDPNTGIGRAGADILTLVTAGSERVRVDASGNVLAGTASGRVVSGYTFLTINNTSGSYVDLLSNGTRVGELGAEPGSLTLAAVGVSIPLILRTNDAARVTIGVDGSVTAADVYGDTVGATNRDLFIDDTGKLGYVSSIRASKTNIAAIEDVSWLRKLTPVSFHYRKRNEDGTYSDDADGTLDYGLIAEDVEPVAKEVCFYDVVDDVVDGEPQLRGVHYSKLITPMLRYIQQLEQRIAALEERINA